MTSNATRTWFLTWTTYATWLPGDKRGFVGPVRDRLSNLKITRNEAGVPYEAGDAAIEASARQLLRGKPIWLTAEHAIVVADQIEATAEYRRCFLYAHAMMANHVHVLLTAPATIDSEALLRDLKAYASRALNERFGKPASGTWWTKSGSKRCCRDGKAIQARFRYVRDQPNALCVRLNSAPR